METIKKVGSVLKRNKGKAITLCVYVLFVMVLPFFSTFVTQYANGTSSVKNADTFFEHYIQALHNKDSGKVLSLLTPEARTNLSTSSAEDLVQLFASSTNQTEGISLHTNTVAGKGVYYDAVYEIKNNDPVYPYLLVDITANNTSGDFLVEGTHITAEKESIKAVNKFDFSKQFPYIIMSLILPIFIAFTGFRYIYKAKNPKWTVFLVIVLVSLYLHILHDSSGSLTTTFNVGVFSAFHTNYLGWFYAFPLPLGAIFYWIRRKHYELETGTK
jgi:hypothetical protein